MYSRKCYNFKLYWPCVFQYFIMILGLATFLVALLLCNKTLRSGFIIIFHAFYITIDHIFFHKTFFSIISFCCLLITCWINTYIWSLVLHTFWVCGPWTFNAIHVHVLQTMSWNFYHAWIGTDHRCWVVVGADLFKISKSKIEYLKFLICRGELRMLENVPRSKHVPKT